MWLRRFALSALITAVSSSASADGWAAFSEHAKMKNYTIADVGDATEVQRPFNPNAEMLPKVYQLNGRCFTMLGYVGFWGYGGKSALLLVNEQKDVELALIETSLSSVKVEMKPISIVRCPTRTDVVPYGDNPEERLRLLRKRQEELQKMIDEYRKLNSGQ